MVRAIEAVVDELGNVRLLEPIALAEAQRAIVMILGEPPKTQATRGDDDGGVWGSEVTSQKRPLRSLLGLWRGIRIPDEDITEARREMWGNIPREDL